MKGKTINCNDVTKNLSSFPIFDIPSEYFISKIEYKHHIRPSCPEPPKIKRGTHKIDILRKKSCPFATAIKGDLSHIYNAESSVSYLDQVFLSKVKIGQGSFGNVYKATSREDQNYYAVKHFNNSHPTRIKFCEVRNMLKLGEHKNLVKFLLAWEEAGEVYIQMEHCDMSLTEYSNRNHQIFEKQLSEIFYDMINALEYLHSRNFVHLDIKPDNILLKGGINKLCDFGLMHDMNSNYVSRKPSEGDARYLAPEILENIYTTKADIFALGISLLELGTDFVMPMTGEAWHALRSGRAPENLKDRLSDNFIVLIYYMICRNVEERPSVADLKQIDLYDQVRLRDLSESRPNYVENLQVLFPFRIRSIVLNDNKDLDFDEGSSIMFQTPDRIFNNRGVFSPLLIKRDLKEPKNTDLLRTPRERKQSPRVARRLKLFS